MCTISASEINNLIGERKVTHKQQTTESEAKPGPALSCGFALLPNTLRLELQTVPFTIPHSEGRVERQPSYLNVFR